jgi:hypothetical protein
MPRQPTEAETAQILGEVQTYLKLPTEELNRILDDSINEADSRGLPHLGIGGSGFWQDYIRRIKRELLQQRLAASATTGFATSQAIVWAHEVGLDLNDYRIPIAIVVALAVKSFWDQIDAGSGDTGQDGGTVDGGTTKK